MPLSEQEQRLLDEMERNLYQNDADFVATVGSRRGRPNYRGIVLGVILVVAGIVALLIGVALRQPIVGVIGFAVMFGGVLVAISPAKSVASAPAGSSSRQTASKPRRSGSFMDTINDRWDRRQDRES